MSPHKFERNLLIHSTLFDKKFMQCLWNTVKALQIKCYDQCPSHAMCTVLLFKHNVSNSIPVNITFVNWPSHVSETSDTASPISWWVAMSSHDCIIHKRLIFMLLTKPLHQIHVTRCLGIFTCFVRKNPNNNSLYLTYTHYAFLKTRFISEVDHRIQCLGASSI